MTRKKWFLLVAVLCFVVTLIIYSTTQNESSHSWFLWIPLVLSAVFLFAANRIK